MSPWIAFGTTFVASALECVEAATIVLAVGLVAGWRTALRATGLALCVLIVIAGLLGPVLGTYVPLGALKIAIGIFLTLFGYTWLRKAIWRYAGRKPMRDERAGFEAETHELQAYRKAADARRAGFAAAFNGVLLEGLEVVAIVVTFTAAGTAGFAWSAGGAIAAAVIVAGSAALLRKPFAQVPENAMAFAVGIMLLSFGTFWSGEGLGIAWWGGVAALGWIVAAYVVAASALAGLWRQRSLRVS